MRQHRRRPPLALALLAAAGLLAPAGPAAAQNTVGEISGYVRDSSGGVLPGSTVTAVFPEIVVTRSTTADHQGYFVLPNLPNGVADLTAELDGFQKSTRRALTVELNARLRVDFNLQVGTLAEVVEVTAGTPAISTRADVAHLISGEQTSQIPIDGRTYMQLVTLVPGVSRNESSYEFGTSLRADGQQINGLRKNFSALTLDGAENLDAGSNATQVNNVSIDAIEEFKVMTSQYSAEYGKSGGAQINVVTKRGKKDFSGGAYYFFRDDNLDARNFRTGEKDVLDFKNFGWNLSGPVVFKDFNKDRSKLFFFVGQEYKRLENQVGLTNVVTVPSLLERQGDFSQSARIPRDPLTGQPFPDGIIPATRLSPNGANLISRFPLPDAGSRNQATLGPTQDRDITETIVRLDVRTGPSSNLSVRMIRDTVRQLEPYGSFGGTSSFAQVPTSHDRWSDSLVVNYNHAIGPRTLNEIGLSAVKNDQNLLQTGDLFTRDGLSIAEIFPSNRLGRAPNIRTMSGYTLGTGLLGNDYPTHIIGNYYTLKDNLSLSRGRHLLKFGVYLGHFRKSEELRTPDAGSFTFSDNRSGGSGVALADALLGLYETYQEADAAPFGNLRYNQVEVYAQDHWQVKPNLTLDYGVRYQYMPPVFERLDQIATFDPARYDPAQAPQISPSGSLVPGTGLIENGLPVTGIAKAGVDGVPRGLYATDWNNIAPRVGFTWDPFKSGRMAVRGGFGIYYDRPVFNSTRDQASSPPFVRTVQISNGSVDNPGGGTASTAPPGGFEAVATDFPMPTVYSYSIGFQRQLPWDLVADVNYVGNQARHLLRVRELNFVTPSPATGLAPTPINANRPFRGYGRIIFNETTGRSEYDSLQIAIDRRANKAFSFGVAYTLGRAKGDSDSEDSTSSGSLAQDPRNLDAELGSLDFDRRHVLAVNYIWRLPTLANAGRLKQHVLGGWQVSGITRYNTGRRYSISAGTNTAIFGDQITLRADLVPGQDPNAEPEGGRTAERWFNTAAFARPATNQLGNSPRSVLEGPGFFNTDVSVFKNFRFAKRYLLQVRGDSFNVFNKKNIRTVETNFTNSRFGQVTAYENQRIFQVGVKMQF
jgi:hypothetical protein